MNKMLIKSVDGTELADIELFEPVSENPTVTVKPLIDSEISDLLVYARDTEGNEFEVPLTVPTTVDN